MSLETKAKELVKLHRHEERLQKNLNSVRENIKEQKALLTEAFEKLGLDSNFSS